MGSVCTGQYLNATAPAAILEVSKGQPNEQDMERLQAWVAAIGQLPVERPVGRRAGFVPVKLPVEILPYLLLGDKPSARNIAKLKELGVTHVLNVAGEEACNSDIDFIAAGIEHVDLDAKDEPLYPMLMNHLEAARTFIERARVDGGRCLVHCMMGINRSGVIVAAEVLLHKRVSVIEAVQLCVRARGPVFLTNESFRLDLVKLADAQGLLGPLPQV